MQLETTPLSLTLPEGYYSDVTWVNEDQVAMAYAKEEPSTIPKQVLIVDLANQRNFELEYPLPKDCPSRSVHILRLRWLKENSIAFSFDCAYFQPAKLFDVTVYTWDALQNKLTLLHEYPPSFRASGFAFSPDMQQGLQEAMGDGIFNQLYSVDASGNLQEVLTEYSRVGLPDWSLDGKKIAFAATPAMPKQKPNIFSGLPGIDQALNQPWSIYTAKPDFSEKIAAVENVLGVRCLQFSPDAQYLAFNTRSFQGKPGIYIVNLDNSKIAQVWQEDVDFNWSPSGQKMIVMVDDETSDNSILIKPLVIDVSALKPLLQ